VAGGFLTKPYRFSKPIRLGEQIMFMLALEPPRQKFSEFLRGGSKGGEFLMLVIMIGIGG
jgi:hypothetical protein